jgi:ABC-type sugar transport system permease subunit
MSGTTPAQSAPFVDVIVNNLQGGNFGMASASGWILFMIIFVITLLQFGAFKKGEE